MFSEVSTTRHLGPGTTLTTCARLSSISSVTGFGAGSGSAAAAGFSTPPRTTNRPPASVRARSTTTPPTACTRRRRRPARVMDGAGGSAVASAIGASSSMAARTSSGWSVGLLAEGAVGCLELVLDPGRALAQLASDAGCGEAGEVGQQEGPALLVGQVVQGVQHVLLLGAQSLLPMPQPGDVPSLRHRPRARAHPLLGVGQAGHLAPVVAGGLERVADRAARRGQVAGERVGLQDQASAARQVELVEVRPGSGSWKGVRKWTRNPAGTGLDRWACQTEANPRASRGWSPSWDRMGRQ